MLTVLIDLAFFPVILLGGQNLYGAALHGFAWALMEKTSILIHGEITNNLTETQQ